MPEAPRAGSEAFNLWAAFLAGLIAGSIFLGLEIASTLAFGAGTPYGPAYVTLRGVLGLGEASEGLGWRLTLSVLFIHLSLSALMTVVLALFVHRQSVGGAVLAGALFGVALYIGNFYLLALPASALLAARGLFMLVNYVAFGALALFGYKRLTRYFAGASPSAPQ